MLYPPLLLLGIVALSLIVLWIIIRSITREFNLPAGFASLISKGHRKPEATVSVRLVTNAFQHQFGTRGIVHFSDHRFISPHHYLLAACDELLREKIPFNVVIDDQLFLGLIDRKIQEGGMDVSPLENDEKLAEKFHITEVVFRYPQQIASINGLKIEKVIVEREFQGPLWIFNSTIKRIILRPNVHLQEFRLFNSHVAILDLEKNSCSEFGVRGGVIGHIHCPPPYRQNPFAGNVTFDRMAVLRTKDVPHLRQDTQSYRNLVAHLLNIGNPAAAKYVLGFTRRAERKDEGWLVRFSSLFYDAFSFYGNNPERALGWLLLLAAYSFALIYVADGGATAAPCSELAGWQTSLCGDNLGARALRSLSLAVGPIINPLSIISRDPIVVPQYVWSNVWLAFQFLISAVLISMVIIGISRRAR